MRDNGFLKVGARGFEPPTPCTPCKCATRLRYAPTRLFLLSWRIISALPRSRKLVVGPEYVKANSSLVPIMPTYDRIPCKGVELFVPSVHDAR